MSISNTENIIILKISSKKLPQKPGNLEDYSIERNLNEKILSEN